MMATQAGQPVLRYPGQGLPATESAGVLDQTAAGTPADAAALRLGMPRQAAAGMPQQAAGLGVGDPAANDALLADRAALVLPGEAGAALSGETAALAGVRQNGMPPIYPPPMEAWARRAAVRTASGRPG
jgi:hypothetical protein